MQILPPLADLRLDLNVLLPCVSLHDVPSDPNPHEKCVLLWLASVGTHNVERRIGEIIWSCHACTGKAYFLSKKERLTQLVQVLYCLTTIALFCHFTFALCFNLPDVCILSVLVVTKFYLYFIMNSNLSVVLFICRF